jgi:hypothetical protein
MFSPRKNGKTSSGDGSDGIFPTSSEPIMVSVKDWCKTSRDERGEISLEGLVKFIREELKQKEPQRVITEAFDQAIIQRSPKPGKAVVV